MERAMTNAERQRAYRQRRKEAADKVELRVTVSKETADRLKRLVRHQPSPMALQTGSTLASLLDTLSRMQESKVTCRMSDDNLKEYFSGYDTPK